MANVTITTPRPSAPKSRFRARGLMRPKPYASSAEDRGAAPEEVEQQAERQVLGREPQRARRRAADEILVLGLADRADEPLAEGLLELVPRLSLLLGELVELVDAAQGQHELLARDAEAAGGRVRRREYDLLQALIGAGHGPVRPRRARVRNRGRLVRRAAERDIRRDERNRDDTRHEERHRLHTLTRPRDHAIGTSAARASSAASRNGRAN